MSSEFENAVGNAVSVQRSVAASNTTDERERAAKAEIAHAITQSYIRDLSPKVLHRLNLLGIEPQILERIENRGLFRGKKRDVIRWWSFGGPLHMDQDSGHHYKDDSRLCVLENGAFVATSPSMIYGNGGWLWDGSQPELLAPPLARRGDVAQSLEAERERARKYSVPVSLREPYASLNRSGIFADPDNRKLHVWVEQWIPFRLEEKAPGVFAPIMELGEYMASYIQFVLLATPRASR